MSSLAATLGIVLAGCSSNGAASRSTAGSANGGAPGAGGTPASAGSGGTSSGGTSFGGTTANGGTSFGGTTANGGAGADFSSSGGSAGSTACGPSQTPCSGVCTDLSSSAEHCGACGTACTTDEVCSAGTCVCRSGLTACGTACVDTQTDGANCGACGTVCPTGQVCAGGRCSPNCAGGQTPCGQSCVDLTSDPSHCGACSTVCPSAQQCTNGACRCASGELCGNVCVNTSTDAANCGTCGTVCTGGRTCTGGSCQCPSGQTFCGAQCVSTATDAANCGGCGKACATGQTCSGGTCSSNLPPGVTALFPAPGAQGQCADPSLRLTFSGAPGLGTSGKIQVFDASTSAAVAAVDMAVTTLTASIGGTTFNLQRPVVVDGNTVVVTLPPHALGYGKTYYVTVDTGAISGPGGASFSIGGSTAWRFSTAAAAPTSLTALSVTLDGSGQFCSVQGALDALPNNNSAATTITIAAGHYFEIVHFRSKNNVTLRGLDRKNTIIEGTNNNNLNPSTATRSLVGIDSSSGLVIDTLTIHNLTPLGGSQAEALRLQSCDKCEVKNADILSYQDTLLWSGRVYADNCLIAGNVDFVWGTGVAYFNNCEIRTVGRAGVNVQARNAVGAYGYVFVDSRLTSDSGITNNYLARIDAGTYPGSHVAYINCTLGSHIAPAGWELTAGTATSNLRFWEYQSTTPAGALVDVSKRMPGSTQISAAQAATMRDVTAVLGGWQPP